ncbi:MAG: LysR family transcriptional regulator [Myxococcales bacterium]|nr:LysR family transcriptional regulator [Myxococcales bacterium]
MDWDDLRYVLALSRSTTLARAAASLDVTHTTVGRRLRSIEARLGVRLFDRTPDGFVATSAGRDLAEVAEQIEGDVHAVEGRMVGRDTRLTGPLHVSTMDMLFCLFHDGFASFTERYPDIELTVSTTLDRVSLTRREADVVLRLTNSPPEYLVGRKVARLQFAVFAAEALVERIGADAPLGAYPWLGWEDGPGARWLDAWLAENAPGARIVMRLDENARAREHALRAGTGVFFMSCLEAEGMPGVCQISEVVAENAHDVWLLTLRELRSTSRVRAFVDHLQEAIERRLSR